METYSWCLASLRSDRRDLCSILRSVHCLLRIRPVLLCGAWYKALPGNYIIPVRLLSIVCGGICIAKVIAFICLRVCIWLKRYWLVYIKVHNVYFNLWMGSLFECYWQGFGFFFIWLRYMAMAENLCSGYILCVRGEWSLLHL